MYYTTLSVYCYSSGRDDPSILGAKYREGGNSTLSRIMLMQIAIGYIQLYGHFALTQQICLANEYNESENNSFRASCRRALQYAATHEWNKKNNKMEKWHQVVRAFRSNFNCRRNVIQFSVIATEQWALRMDLCNGSSSHRHKFSGWPFSHCLADNVQPRIAEYRVNR